MRAGPIAPPNVADSRIDDLRKRLERDPGSRLFAQLAEEHRKAGELAEAIRVARSGLAQHGVYASARLTLGRALLDTGDAAGARQELELALRQAPDNILASRFLGQALEQLGDLEGALQQYAATLKLAPGDQQLAAHVQELGQRAQTGRRQPEVPTGPMARAIPPPLPASRAVAGVGGAAEPPAPTLRLPPKPEPAAITTPERPLAAAAATPAPEAPQPDVGSATLPAGALTAEPRANGSSEEGGEASPPFSSSTLAELYLRQGLQGRAVEVYRQVLAEDPGNARARARLAAIEVQGVQDRLVQPSDPSEARRLVLERTIAGLEGMLASARRR